MAPRNPDHPSRRAWPAVDDEPAEHPRRRAADYATTHSHKVPAWIWRSIVALAAATALSIVGMAVLAVYVYQQEQYIQGRGEQRDRERTELQQQIQESICDLLDQLPEGGLLDGPRDKWQCGPGRPLDEFPEDVRRRYEPPEPQSVAPAPAVEAPPLGSPAVPNPPRPGDIYLPFPTEESP